MAQRRGAAAKPENLPVVVASEGAYPDTPDEEEVEKPNPLFTRWVSNKDGVRLGVPEEWLGKQAGRLFGPPVAQNGGIMTSGMLVEELD